MVRIAGSSSLRLSALLGAAPLSSSPRVKLAKAARPGTTWTAAETLVSQGWSRAVTAGSAGWSAG